MRDKTELYKTRRMKIESHKLTSENVEDIVSLLDLISLRYKEIRHTLYPDETKPVIDLLRELIKNLQFILINYHDDITVNRKLLKVDYDTNFHLRLNDSPLFTNLISQINNALHFGHVLNCKDEMFYTNPSSGENIFMSNWTGIDMKPPKEETIHYIKCKLTEYENYITERAILNLIEEENG